MQNNCTFSNVISSTCVSIRDSLRIASVAKEDDLKKLRKILSTWGNLKKIRKSPSDRSHVKKNASTANDTWCGVRSTTVCRS